jgi:hypothetical protein
VSWPICLQVLKALKDKKLSPNKEKIFRQQQRKNNECLQVIISIIYACPCRFHVGCLCIGCGSEASKDSGLVAAAIVLLAASEQLCWQPFYL